MVSRFPDSPDSPSRTSNFNSLRPRVGSDYFSLEDKVVFWCSGAYKKYPRSYGADHRVCGGHCPTSGHSGPRTPVNDLLRWFLRVVNEAASLKVACGRPPDAALQPALTARACTRTPSSRACRCAQSMRSWCCSSAALRPHRFPASPPSVVPLPPAPPPADAVVRALSGSRPRGGGSSVGPGRAARLEDGTPTRVPILSFCSFLPVSRLCRETAECVPS